MIGMRMNQITGLINFALSDTTRAVDRGRAALLAMKYQNKLRKYEGGQKEEIISSEKSSEAEDLPLEDTADRKRSDENGKNESRQQADAVNSAYRLKQAMLWSEILGEPVCKKRRPKMSVG